MRGDVAKNVPSRLLRIPEAADRLTISVRGVWAMIASGQLSAIRLGRRVTRVDAAEVEAVIVAATERAGR